MDLDRHGISHDPGSRRRVIDFALSAFVGLADQTSNQIRNPLGIGGDHILSLDEDAPVEVKAAA